MQWTTPSLILHSPLAGGCGGRTIPRLCSRPAGRQRKPRRILTPSRRHLSFEGEPLSPSRLSPSPPAWPGWRTTGYTPSPCPHPQYSLRIRGVTPSPPGRSAPPPSLSAPGGSWCFLGFAGHVVTLWTLAILHHVHRMHGYVTVAAHGALNPSGKPRAV